MRTPKSAGPLLLIRRLEGFRGAFDRASERFVIRLGMSVQATRRIRAIGGDGRSGWQTETPRGYEDDGQRITRLPRSPRDDWPSYERAAAFGLLAFPGRCLESARAAHAWHHAPCPAREVYEAEERSLMLPAQTTFHGVPLWTRAIFIPTIMCRLQTQSAISRPGTLDKSSRCACDRASVRLRRSTEQLTIHPFVAPRKVGRSD